MTEILHSTEMKLFNRLITTDNQSNFQLRIYTMTDEKPSNELGENFKNIIEAFEPADPYLSDAYDDVKVMACSECFSNIGVRLEAQNLTDETGECPRCKSISGLLLTQQTAVSLAYRFYALGTMHEADYGRAPLLVFNEHNKTTSNIKSANIPDLETFEEILGMGFFEYGPPLWMLGEIEPLKALRKKRQRPAIVHQILEEYPPFIFPKDRAFFRVRVNPSGNPSQQSQYDSPPKDISFENGRWDSKKLPAMYCSPDIQTCLHECKVHVSDNAYMASLVGEKDLKLLDLTHHLEESGDWFNSLDLAIQYLFQAGTHSYDISRAIALGAKEAGYDGLFVPSHFSSLRTGHHYFQAIKGMPVRAIPQLRDQQRTKLVPNLVLFDHPIIEGKVKVLSVNRVHMERAQYTLRFGPVIDENLFFF